MHTCNYCPDPVAGNPRIKATYKALDKRVREPAQIKLLATKEVVTSAMKRVAHSEAYSARDKETVNAAMQSAWLFLLQSSEYCFVDGGIHDYCLRLGDVAFYDEGKGELPFREAQSAVTMDGCRSSSEGPRRTKREQDASAASIALDSRLMRSRQLPICCSPEVTSG